MRDEIRSLQVALARRESGRGKRFAPEVRQQIIDVGSALRRAGSSWRQVGQALALRTETVRRLCGASRPRFTAVEVVDERAQLAGAYGIVIVTPGGYRVEHLTVTAAAALLRQLP